MIIGFTGTRFGMTAEQLASVAALIQELTASHGSWLALHGDCVGADAQFHDLARAAHARVIVHPGPADDLDRQAGCIADYRRIPERHMRRNANIVDESQLMIAAPREAAEQPRGGTWGTIRIARHRRRPLALVSPDGAVLRERWIP